VCLRDCIELSATGKKLALTGCEFWYYFQPFKKICNGCENFSIFYP
jgi:hypothetical protein